MTQILTEIHRPCLILSWKLKGIFEGEQMLRHGKIKQLHMCAITLTDL